LAEAETGDLAGGVRSDGRVNRPMAAAGAAKVAGWRASQGKSAKSTDRAWRNVREPEVSAMKLVSGRPGVAGALWPYPTPASFIKIG
jgi:hypothetical protein